MVILPLNILSLIAQFVLLAIDISIMLTIVRLLRQRWSNNILVAIDNAGLPIVNWFTSKTNIFWRKLQNHQQLSVKGQLILALVMLMTLRFLIVSIFYAMK